MKEIFFIRRHILPITLAGTVLASSMFAQSADQRAAPEGSGNTYWYVFLLGLGVLGMAFYLRKKSKKSIETPAYNYKNPNLSSTSSDETYEDGLDADKELEWLRKAKTKNAPATAVKKPALKPALGVRSKPISSVKANGPAKPTVKEEEPSLDLKMFQQKMRRLRFAQLPVNSFTELKKAGLYEPLPISDDPAVLNAIEQVSEEYEEDEMVRELALRILAAFRTRNSIEALSQIALYDLSANLRSKAVVTLTDFDHETVFETILLACADPTREVRAAAARGLFKLNFDRADAWKRIIETGDEYRMSHAARAATEAGIVLKSLDRLVHEDHKVAYEAFCLVSMLIRAGETDEIFEAIRNHRDEPVKYALLHVLKVTGDERTMEPLQELLHEGSCPMDVNDKIRDAVNAMQMVMA